MKDDYVPDDKPSDISMEYGNLEDVMNSYSFKDVGGLSKVTAEMEKYARAIANPDIFKAYGIKPPKGLVLYGPPGTGKTLLAKCFAAEVGKYIQDDNTAVMFGQLSLEDFVSEYVGKTSSNLDKILGMYNKSVVAAKKQGLDLKIVLYLDEMDSIGAKREGTHEAYSKMMGVLLKYMDGMNSNDSIYWIGSTNRIESLDSALVRPGRFDKLIEVNGYDKGGIKDIYKIHMNKATEKSEFKELFRIRGWDEIEEASKNMSGAEIAEIVRRTIEYSLWRSVNRGQCKVPLKKKHIMKEIELYYGSRKKSEKKKIGF